MPIAHTVINLQLPETFKTSPLVNNLHLFISLNKTKRICNTLDEIYLRNFTLYNEHI